MKRLLIVLLALAAVLSISEGVLAMSSANYRLDWFTPGTSNGGGTLASSQYVLDVTIGQTAIGQMSSPGHRASLGYWYELVRAFRAFLPAVMRGRP